MIKTHNKKLNYMEDSVFWENGYKLGLTCKKHPDRVVQEAWNKTAGAGKLNYFQFQEWLSGYKFSKKNNY